MARSLAASLGTFPPRAAVTLRGSGPFQFRFLPCTVSPRIWCKRARELPWDLGT